jgi:hypothetical protein
MFAKCANYWCSASRQPEEVFPAEFQLGKKVGNAVRLWLCTRCVQEMKPSPDASPLFEAGLSLPSLGVTDSMRARSHRSGKPAWGPASPVRSTFPR